MRVLLLIPLAVLAIAGAVLISSETQRDLAATHRAEDRTAERMLSNFLLADLGLQTHMATGETDGLVNFFEGKRRVSAGLDTAAKISADDPREAAGVRAQRSAWLRWQAMADRLLARMRPGTSLSPEILEALDGPIDRFVKANEAYKARLAVVSAQEDRRAARVPVVVILVLSALFGAIGTLLARRARGNRRAQRDAERTWRDVNDSFTASQTRFGEALQVAESQAEAHALLTAHLKKSIPDSSALVLNRNNSADRLEPTSPLSSGHPLAEPLAQAEPRSCLAVRLSRRYDRSEDSDEVLECGICGRLSTESTCEPLLVGGEVIGSVLVSSDGPLAELSQRRIDSSVTQAAPVLANLRNLAIAETRAATDALTGLPNKRALDDSYKRMLAHAGRTATPLSVILLDLDHFKKINDTHGHDRGDEALAAVGVLLRSEVRASDLPGRIGGEEFVVLLPDTDRAGALNLAEKLRRSLHAVKIRDLSGPLTASFGVSTFPDDSIDGETLMRVADRALYVAKQHGRDRVEAPSSANHLLAAEPTSP